MHTLSVAITGGTSAAAHLLRALSRCQGVRVQALVNPLPDSPAALAAAELDIDVVPHWRRVAPLVDVLIEASGQPELRAELRRELPRSVALIEGGGTALLEAVLAETGEAAQASTFTELLLKALDVIHEGVEITDAAGIIRYVNPSFSAILGVGAQERLGRSIFEVSPDGGIARVLRTGRPTTGVRNRPRGSSVEVVSNASPIYRGQQLVGGVTVFRDVSEVLRLSRELRRKEALVESLYDEIGAMHQATYTFADLVGDSPRLLSCIELGRKAAASTATVLIEGETGTGKEILAHAIHNASTRRGRAFIKVNSSAIPESLLESEFFGYEQGAFTGATRRRPGKLELASGGTLFLDEVGDMSPALQVKLLRALQEREFHRVGGAEPVRVDVRVIAATNANLLELVERGLFRRDLYYRLNVLHIRMPPLRERPEDIPALTRHILQTLCRRLGRPELRITPQGEALLSAYHWPGNVRELENLLERIAHVLPHDTITADSLRQHYPPLQTRAAPEGDGIIPLEEAERRLIRQALATFGTSLAGKKRAAEALGISLSTLYNKIRSSGEQAAWKNKSCF